MKKLFILESIFLFSLPSLQNQPHPAFLLPAFFAHLFSPQRCTAVSKCAHCTEISPLPVSMKNVAHSSSEGKRAWSFAQTGF